MIFLHVSGLWFMVRSKTRNLCARIPKTFSTDASIYNGSELKEGLESPNNIFNLPEEKSLAGDDVPVPY
jgi:hypothetical protein